MQNLHALVGARGRAWRVERVESFPRRGGQAFLHLTSRDGGPGGALIAVRPFEPAAHLAVAEALRPVPASRALAIVEQRARDAHTALSLRAAARLKGDIHAWQLAAALAFERGHARVLTADAAGMGKTVSAGLAIAQCLDGFTDRRCLVIAPGHLLRQWQLELARRLEIEARIIDAGALGRMQREVPAGVPVWSLPGCSIVSMDFFKQPHILKSLDAAVWDLLVVDEAHLACGVSERRDAADLVARRSRRVLLLTATPSDGGGERLGALVSLGAAGERLIQLRHVAAERAAVERRVWIGAGAATSELHDALAAYTRWIACGPRLETPDAPAVALLCSLLTRRALSSAHAARLSLVRRLALIGRDPQPVQPSLFEPADDPGVLGASTGLPIDRERRRLDMLVAIAVRAARDDRRLRALARLLMKTREPVIVFTCFRDTALLVARRLAAHTTTRLVHGEMPQATIDAALESFTTGATRVLVATDVAAQGLNLHYRCRWVVHYDLPWRPTTLRQRLGRVDRLGQTRRAHATFLLDHTTLAQDALSRMTALTERMHGDERLSDRRWAVLAAAEAHRLLHLRARNCAPATAPPPPAITVLETEYVDAAGMTVERAVAGFAARESAATDDAARGTRRRTLQLRRRLVGRMNRRINRERAVLAAALETGAPALRQDGLFDRRTDRIRHGHAAVRERLEQAAREAIERHTLEGHVAATRTRTIATFTALGK